MKPNDFPSEFAHETNNIAIDFDGVIHDAYLGFYDGTCYGLPVKGSLEAIKELSKSFRIIIFTAKAKPNRPLINNKTGKELVKDWLQKYEILDHISEVTCEKPRAILYIDDNAYRFLNWKDTLEFVKSNEG